ncbi:adenosine deaminase [Pengzhenrongella frigida]|uniref:adenosine deaminase n=1 Tax=Pengzhenrongella frigida TaxID=1259133 RepID=A0A4Q5N1R1_9MICO|nr:adenosine deaminase [Cellulomonas sp. HLT2-17]RYV52015.1 adenosine deaminase [Cellulomonas sp. HLT2-17]
MPIDESAIAALPKVVLHDHLDGGLRPATIVELAATVGHALPTTDPAELGEWFVRSASSGSLEQYLATFEHTVAVMQTEDALRRVAREAVADLVADGVVYAEERYAPEQHQRTGLSLQQVVDAVQAGFAEGVAEAASTGHVIRVGTLLTAMRQTDRGEEIARLALENRERGVLGFDTAGPEAGFPPTLLETAFRLLAEANFPVTIHAGEAAGLDSIAQAVHVGHASRIGHGLRIVDDIDIVRAEGDPADKEPGVEDEARLGALAHWIRDHQIPLELCPTSNVQTGAAQSIAQHPITLLKDLGFAVTINTDNRLQSGTTVTREMTLLATEAGWTLDDLRDATVTAAWNAFIHHDEREALVDDHILPAFGQPVAGRHRA